MDSNSNQEDYLCPSYLSKPGAELFAYVAEGQLQYLNETVVIDKTFTEAAKKGRSPESRFRFAGKCIKGGCAQWDNGNSACGLSNKLINAVTPQTLEATLQHCAIRAKCRWFAQNGAAACGVCSESVRNMEEAFITS